MTPLIWNYYNVNRIKTEEDFKTLALQNYDNPLCFSKSEFVEDVKRFQYVSNLFEKYKKTQLINERLLLNHLIILNNLFGHFTAYGLFYKVSPFAWVYLKTYLLFLGLMPTDLDPNNQIKTDSELLQKLENI